MADDVAILQVELEDVGAASCSNALLAILTSQYGNAYLRFVGRVNGESRYASPTFPVPRAWGDIPPQEQWAPEMAGALEVLRSDLERDGWVAVGRGERAWQLRYERNAAPSRV